MKVIQNKEQTRYKHKQIKRNKKKERKKETNEKQGKKERQM